jgi:uncharacterized protein (DUF58 family)
VNHELVAFIAKLLVYSLLLLLPALIATYSDRFRKPISPENYLVLLAIMAAIGVLLFLPVISIVAATALLALGIAWFYGRYSLSGLSYERTLTPSRLFPGDEATLTIRLNNHKLLPLAWLSISDPIQLRLMRAGDTIDDLLRFSGGVEMLENLGYALVNQVALAPYQSVNRSYTVQGIRRGTFTFGPAELEAGDPFGMFTRRARMGDRQEVVVFPNVFSPDEIGLPFREALGDASTRRSLVEDPIRIAGAREYRPDDPLRRMHWKATARTGQLQVRIVDPSTTAQIIVVLNLNTFQYVWQGVDLDRMESTIDVAASAAIWALRKGFSVGLRSNGIVPGTEMTPRLAPSASPQQPTLLLEHLARLAFSGRYSAEYVLHDESLHLASASTVLFVTSIITPEIIEVLTSRKLVGRVAVVYCGRFAAPVVRGVPIYLATPPSRGTLHAVS